MTQAATRTSRRATGVRNSPRRKWPLWRQWRWRRVVAGLVCLAAGGTASAQADSERTDGQLRGYLAAELSRAGVMVDARELPPHVYHLLIDRMVEPRDPDGAAELREAARDTRFER